MCAELAAKAGHAAIDLGAGSGRIFFGTAGGFEEIFRFPNTWDFCRTLEYIREGLSRLEGRQVLSVSTDSWAQDFGLLDREGRLCYPPVSYLTGRAAAVPDQVEAEIPGGELFQLCGVRKLGTIATLAQWRYMAQAEPEALAVAGRLLPVADLVNQALCGIASLDFSLGSAALLLTPGTADPNRRLIRKLGLDDRLIPEGSVMPRVLGGCLRGGTAPDFLAGVSVISGVGHDTAAAFYGADVRPEECFISCGSWAMIGTAGGPEAAPGCIRFGIIPGQYADFVSRSGMRCLHCCVRQWQQENRWPGFKEFDAMVAESDFAGTFDMNELVFNPDGTGVAAAIAACCRPRPETLADFGRAICRSEAAAIVSGIRELASGSGKNFTAVRVGGGGGSDPNLLAELRRQLPMPVIPSCREAAVQGNLLIQSRVLAGRV